MSDFSAQSYINQFVQQPQQQAAEQPAPFVGQPSAQAGGQQPWGSPNLNQGHSQPQVAGPAQYVSYAYGQQSNMAVQSGNAVRIDCDIEFDQTSSTPEVSTIGMGYVASSGLYYLNIQEADYYDNEDGSKSISLFGIATALNDAGYQGRLSVSIRIPQASKPDTLRSKPSFEALIKVTGMYKMHDNRFKPDLAYVEVPGFNMPRKSITGFIGQQIIVAVHASSRTNRKGVPYFYLSSVFYPDKFSFDEKMAGASAPSFIKEFTERTGRYFIAFDGRPLINPQAEGNGGMSYGQPQYGQAHSSYSQPQYRATAPGQSGYAQPGQAQPGYGQPVSVQNSSPYGQAQYQSPASPQPGQASAGGQLGVAQGTAVNPYTSVAPAPEKVSF